MTTEKGLLAALRARLRRESDDDLSDELRFHMEMETEAPEMPSFAAGGTTGSPTQ